MSTPTRFELVSIFKEVAFHWRQQNEYLETTDEPSDADYDAVESHPLEFLIHRIEEISGARKEDLLEAAWYINSAIGLSGLKRHNRPTKRDLRPLYGKFAELDHRGVTETLLRELWSEFSPELLTSIGLVSSRPPGASAGTRGDNQPKHRALWVAEAMLLIKDHPNWADRKVAEQVGISPSQLSRCQEYRIAAKLARGSKDQIPKGHRKVDAETGLSDIEAEDPGDRSP